MGKYVDTDVLERLFYNWANDKHTSLYDAFGLAIDDCPEADVQEVIHGKWSKPNNRSKTYLRRCSICDKIAYFCGDGNYNYCPNCGNPMDG